MPQPTELLTPRAPYGRSQLASEPSAARDWQFHIRLGDILYNGGRIEEAESNFRQAARLGSRNVSAHLKLALVLYAQSKLSGAEACVRTALSIERSNADCHNFLAVVLSEQGRFFEAEHACRAALAERPAFPEALTNLGLILTGQRRLKEAEEAHRSAIKLRQAYPEAAFNLGLLLLLLGEYAEGWALYEERWKIKLPNNQRFANIRRWAGEHIQSLTLLLHSEQGFGDTIQFCRYAPILSQDNRIILEVQPALKRLISSLSDNVEVVARGDDPPRVDVHCPLMSVPGICGTTVGLIPTGVPYLLAPQDLRERWRSRLRGLSGVKVGLVWAGGARPAHTYFGPMDKRRSMSLQTLAPLGAVSGITFVSLQKGPHAQEATCPPPGMALIDYTEELHDFAETAALIENLDLVIGVDTAVVHLAGALGKSVWLLNRYDTCWRWMLDRDDCPWYPTLRQFRQRVPNDWRTVITDVQAALTSLSLARSP